jgi:hypothetical protein
MRRPAALLIIGLLVLLLAGASWHYARRFVFYRLTVLEVPIRFEKGFSLNHQFTVDTPANYWVGIQYNEMFRITVATPIPQDEFTAESEVSLQNKVIAKGGTSSLPSWSGPWASNRDHITRYLNSFHAEPGKRYLVSLRITGLLPGLVGKDPKALVEIEPRFTLFYRLRKLLFVCLVAAIGTIALSISAGFLLGLRRRKANGRRKRKKEERRKEEGKEEGVKLGLP